MGGNSITNLFFFLGEIEVIRREHHPNGGKVNGIFKTMLIVFQQSRFATGMDGDEDLGGDNIMKGKPYHF